MPGGPAPAARPDQDGGPASRWFAALLDFAVPAVCPCCQAAAAGARGGLCVPCRDALEPVPCPWPWCAAPHGIEACQTCEDRGFPGIGRVVVPYAYDGALRVLVGTAKAGASSAAVAAIARLAPGPAAALLAEHPRPPVVVPVPASPGRRPGPHLGTAIARAIARHHHLPCAHLLRHTRAAAEQHVLSAAERQDNVAGLFRSVGAVPEDVLLVDDLATSGATLASAGRALRAGGARRISAFCIARSARRG